jgi:hypothetical protein
MVAHLFYFIRFSDSFFLVWLFSYREEAKTAKSFQIRKGRLPSRPQIILRALRSFAVHSSANPEWPHPRGKLSPLACDQYFGSPHGRINREDAPHITGQANTKEIEIYLSGLRVFAVSLLTGVPLTIGRKTIEKTTASIIAA